jgi:hypothetical protein
MRLVHELKRKTTPVAIYGGLVKGFPRNGGAGGDLARRSKKSWREPLDVSAGYGGAA